MLAAATAQNVLQDVSSADPAACKHAPPDNMVRYKTILAFPVTKPVLHALMQAPQLVNPVKISSIIIKEHVFQPVHRSSLENKTLVRTVIAPA